MVIISLALKVILLVGMCLILVRYWEFFFALGLEDQVFEYLLHSYHSHSYVSWYSGQLVSINLPTNHCSNSTMYIYLIFLHGLSPTKICFQNKFYEKQL